jgi:ABC-2 type transport system ATP-binding protein
VNAERSSDQLKAKVGDARIEVTLPEAADLDAAVAAVRAQASGPVTVDAARRRIAAPAPSHEGITSDVMHSLDAAGVRVTGITFHQPSLDDVFLTLTGHQAGGEASDDRAGHGGLAQADGEAA